MTDTEADQFLRSLGWSAFFEEQIEPDEAGLLPRRVASVHRTELAVMSETGPIALALPPKTSTADMAVGDWVLADPRTGAFLRRLDRKSLLQRSGQGRRTPQLAAANVDTLFIVTSCNSDFNIARLERYLALANDAGTTPVIVLTKADQCDNAAEYQQQAADLQRELPVVILNPRVDEAHRVLAEWCAPGQTTAVVGSSGVGKSTLVNSLAGHKREDRQKTGDVREHDAKGRHTTTSRSLHPIVDGGWVIDTPGIRTLQLNDVGEGIDTLFAEITELAPQCKFRDCTHSHEPGCAVQAAVKAGKLDVERLNRWRKLQDENSASTASPAAGRTGRR